MELGLHIADFTWNGGSAQLGADLAKHAQNAEAAGISRITVMDHFWQITPVTSVCRRTVFVTAARKPSAA